jgi:hypothetical protein
LGTLRGKRSRAIFEPKKYKEAQLALIKSIFDSNDCISKLYETNIYGTHVKLTFFLAGYNTIENLYPYSNATDLIADNYDANSYLALNTCVIKKSIKDAAKSTLESVTDYCDLNVSCEQTTLFNRHLSMYNRTICQPI